MVSTWDRTVFCFHESTGHITSGMHCCWCQTRLPMHWHPGRHSAVRLCWWHCSLLDRPLRQVLRQPPLVQAFHSDPGGHELIVTSVGAVLSDEEKKVELAQFAKYTMPAPTDVLLLHMVPFSALCHRPLQRPIKCSSALHSQNWSPAQAVMLVRHCSKATLLPALLDN